MANTFLSNLVSNITTTSTALLPTPVVASAQLTVIGLSIANKAPSIIFVDVYITRSTTNYYLIKGGPVPAGSSLVVIGGQQKLALQPGDQIYALSTVATSADGMISYLLITP